MNKSSLVPIKETALITLGELITSLIVIAVFLLIKRYDYTVLTGVILGSAVIIINFLVMSILINRAIDEAFTHRSEYVDLPSAKPEEDEASAEAAEDSGEIDDNNISEEKNPELDAAMRFAQEQSRRVQNISKISFFVRTLMMLGALVLALLSSHFNPIATCIPMLMLRPIIMVEGLIRRKK